MIAVSRSKSNPPTGCSRIATPPTCIGVVDDSMYRKETSRGLRRSGTVRPPPFMVPLLVQRYAEQVLELGHGTDRFDVVHPDHPDCGRAPHVAGDVVDHDAALRRQGELLGRVQEDLGLRLAH